MANIQSEIVRTVRLAARLASLTGNRDAAVGKSADEIANAIGEKRRALTEACFAHARQIGDIAQRLQRSSLHVRLPILRQLKDEDLVRLEADLRRKTQEAKKAELDRHYDAKRGIRPVRRAPKPVPQRDPVREQIHAMRLEQAAARTEAVKALSGLNLLGTEPEAAE
jgi:hypothetical protein